MSDPVDGKFRILSTSDGGRSWKVLPSAGMPAALDGEAGFAASGQCLVSSGPRDVWLATGGGAHARVLHSADRGLTWSGRRHADTGGRPGQRRLRARLPRPHARTRGRRRLPRRPGLAAGGRAHRGRRPHLDDGCRSSPPAYRSGVAWLPYSRTAALAVGPTGTDLTPDAGRTWKTVDTGSYDTVDCTPDLGCWAAGEKGRVARLES